MAFKQYREPEDLQRAVDGYFLGCELSGEPFSLTGLCLALDMTRLTLLKYEERESYRDIVQMAKLRIENSYELSLRKKHVIGIIFALKQFGWEDSFKHDVSGEFRITVEDID